MVVTTKTDLDAVKWRINDAPVRVREWGTDINHWLPQSPTTGCMIGTDESCEVRLVDSKGVISRRHCRLTLEQTKWMIRDLDSKNGMFIDGAPRSACVVEPGIEIRIGGITLLVESPRLIALRGFLSRLLGWGADRLEVVDLALRSVRMTVTQRAALVLCGDHDLVPIALELHRHVLGEDRPFVLCDPRRIRSEPTVRSVQSFTRGMLAFEAARGGSVCMWSKRRPRDFTEFTAVMRRPSAHAQLIVCAHTPAEARAFVAAPIIIPSLMSRKNEIDRIIDEYGADATASLGVPVKFDAEDRDWVRTYSASSLADIQKGTRRLVALRHAGSTAGAAALLGMAAASLQEWIGRRRLPVPRLDK